MRSIIAQLFIKIANLLRPSANAYNNSLFLERNVFCNPSTLAEGLATIIREQHNRKNIQDRERMDIITKWVTSRLFHYSAEELVTIIEVLRHYLKTHEIRSPTIEISVNDHYTKNFLTTTIYSACHAYSKDSVAFSRKNSVLLSMRIFPSQLGDSSDMSVVNNLYKKVDTPIEILALEAYDREQKLS